ncbi:Oxygen regulatory protein NreC [Marinobacterium sp. xm-d-420]|uniref:response regulator transcription factor n=1 Tax=Marinobacterium sp. xm-d-420 TaxID=2497737 RepID=UPI001569081A|nr:response regulator transcription factor [Marinobacterium sp. xm-d-420]NRP28717.1 Oxygen regulatory protein NreC [Marinobacterium sp. xm-d-420]
MRKLSVVIVDDQVLMTEALKVLLESSLSRIEFDVLATLNSGIEGLEAVHHYQPDLLLVDLRMPEMDGIEVITRLRASHDSTKIIVLSAFDQFDQIELARNAGANGYILKLADQDSFIDTIERVFEGDEQFVAEILNSQISQQVDFTLSERELQVLKMLSQGFTNAEMATPLNLSVRTVEKYRATLNDKFETRSLSLLVKKAREFGFIA